MTAIELRDYFNDNFGLGHWPDIYEVDHNTFANVCSFVFKRHLEMPQRIDIALGKNGGIFFKGVEVLLKENKT